MNQYYWFDQFIILNSENWYEPYVRHRMKINILTHILVKLYFLWHLSNTFTKNTKKVVFVWLEDKLFRCLRSCHMRCFFLAIIIIKCSLHRGTKSSDCINPVCIRRGIHSSTLGLGRFMIYMHCVVYPVINRCKIICI